ILNLINNAFYAVNERQKKDKDSGYKPRVTLTTSKQGDQVVIEVADNGTGMPKQVKEKIFQPFFTTKPTGEGTGLGLSLSYDIVTKGHGGTMKVETTEGIGTRFIVSLPA
ncbi:MAG: GHKL domain-containing protein, partial [Chitinophagaceae bacterium]|nr:GHKL domain-containing protein [Chitinophagaceae bacterium]